MYKIIGVDGREYGPVTPEQLREWVTAGRANGQTRAQAEGSTEWRPLCTFAEFAWLAAALPVPPLTSSADNRKSKLAAGLLGIFVGGFGVHRFYLGYTGIGVAQIVVTFLTCGVGALWGLIEGILILTGSSITTDADGQTLKD
jgi:TM2 domain-containing membrane protein YozV